MKKTYFSIFVFLSAVILFAGPNDKNKAEKKPLKPVLLVIDTQNQYLPYMAEQDKKFALEMINETIGLFRKYGFPVIRVYHTTPEYGPKPDTEAFEFPSSIKIKPEDHKIIKNYPSAFKNTELDKLLHEMDCNTLYLCGLSAVGCVLATYYSALDLDYNVFMVRNALLSHNSTYTKFIEEIFDTVSYKTIKVMLECAQQ